MAGRHTQKSSKAPVVIISISVIAVIAVLVCIFIFLNTGSKTVDTNATTEAVTTANQTTEQTTAEATVQSETADNSYVAEESTDSETSETQIVVVPTKNGGEVSYFNATYAPYKAIDTSTNEECSLREVFGNGERGVITFNSDGTFYDGVNASKPMSGAYAVEGDVISATYSNDKNMSVTVTSWNSDAPGELIINYGGYDVYFS